VLWPQPGAVPYRQDIDCVSNFVSHNVRFVNDQFTSAFNPTRSACIRIGWYYSINRRQDLLTQLQCSRWVVSGDVLDDRFQFAQ